MLRRKPSLRTSAMLLVLWAIVGLASSMFGSPASATPLPHVRNGVGVLHTAAGQHVALHEPIPAGEGRQRSPSYDQSVVGGCVGP